MKKSSFLFVDSPENLANQIDPKGHMLFSTELSFQEQEKITQKISARTIQKSKYGKCLRISLPSPSCNRKRLDSRRKLPLVCSKMSRCHEYWEQFRSRKKRVLPCRHTFSLSAAGSKAPPFVAVTPRISEAGRGAGALTRLLVEDGWRGIMEMFLEEHYHVFQIDSVCLKAYMININYYSFHQETETTT